MNNVSLLAIEKIAKKNEIKRISKDSIEELRFIIQELGKKISKDAVEISLHSGKRTVQERDIEFASKF